MQSSDVTAGKPSGLGGPWKPCSRFDANRDGRLSHLELKEAFETLLGTPTSWGVIGALFEHIDRERDHGISRAELQQALKEMAVRPITTDDVEGLFMMFVSNAKDPQNGVIEKGAFIHVLELVHGEKFRAHHSSKFVFEELDTDHNGFLTWSEFKAAFSTDGGEEKKGAGIVNRS